VIDRDITGSNPTRGCCVPMPIHSRVS